MKILDNQKFNTQPISSEQSAIFLGNTNTGKNIDGCYLELCIKTGYNYLIFMTDDIPNEDMLHIHFLNESLDILDSATIGSMYSTGTFRDYNIQGENTVTFYFIGETQWKVEILENKEFTLPLISQSKGVSRKNIFSQYFKIYGNPKSGV
ncbi:hypothetical protein [Pseudocolwellia agarivorans]|uniref:hypothetical protein n=1 Tax=Pseudocolwellia agarivorans TaxID=1911682 RepID=UPI0009879E93|nr:hypothetical protein [Pseudocolwellia agarivorans]